VSAPLRVWMPADVRFPLERANGVQTVKMAVALAKAGVPTTLVVRRSDPRSDHEILGLFGLSHPPGLSIRRLSVFHRRGAFVLSRLAFLCQAWGLGMAALRRGEVVYTRDLQLADLLLQGPSLWHGRVGYEAHAVEALMYEERGALYGTAQPVDPRKTARLDRRERRVWRRAGTFVATTRGIVETFAARHGPREDATAIPNGCDGPADPAFPGLAREVPPRVLYAGQLYPWKGVDVLVEAIGEASSARLVILGGLPGEADLERIRSRVHAFGLENRCELLGTVPQFRVAEELRRAAVVVVPFLKSVMTERHTSPLKAFEAMAAGRPIVCSDLPSSREFLDDGVSALLVPPGDAVALGRAIARLLADPALAERLAREAHQRSRAYSWETRAQRLRQVLEAGVRSQDGGDGAAATSPGRGVMGVDEGLGEGDR
jgi:glycosyltransferase involved in cell wall biosynthesis